MNQQTVKATSGPAVVAGILLLLLVVLSPLAVVEVPPLVDYPNHLARAYITASIAEDPALAANYRIDWALRPSLAMDVILPPLIAYLPLRIASLVPVAGIFVLWVCGAVLLHRVLFGRWAFWPALSVLFLYNAPLAWGFLSFLFTGGIVLLAFTGWIASAGRPGWPRRIALLVVALFVFLGHLVAFGLFALLVGCYELGRLARQETRTGSGVVKDVVANIAMLPLPLLLMLQVGPSRLSVETIYGDVAKKLEALFSPVLQYGFRIDLPLFLAVVLVLGLALTTGRLKIAPALRVPLAGVTLVALVMPFQLFGVAYMDIRLPFVVFILLVAGTRIVPARPFEARALIAVFCALLACRVWVTHTAWRVYDVDYRSFIELARVIEPGARLLTATGPVPRNDFRDALDTHIAAFAVIESRVFLPDLFTGVTILRPHPDLVRLDASVTLPAPLPLLRAEYRRSCRSEASPPPDLPSYLVHWQRNFHYLAVFQQRAAHPVVGLPLQLLAEGPAVAIYRISDDCAALSALKTHQRFSAKVSEGTATTIVASAMR